jgi:ABC-type phosphate transport system substrate-binding protein
VRGFLHIPARLAAATLLAAALAGAPQAASGASYAQLLSSGSSWAYLAIDQWITTMSGYGLSVDYTPNGSASGRNNYMQGQDDFAGSDPPFRDGRDALAGTNAEKSPYGYSYVPDTAGGTAFIYHISVGGHLVRNLRLSGETIMKIFTGQIKNWDDRAITHDYGAQLPNIPIVPVIRSDGSGATYFFSRWMAHEFPSQWDAFCTRVTSGRVRGSCPQTEFYPTSGPGWNYVKAENGSTAVSDYITSAYANGAIGYDEYAYAINSHYPVVKVLNPAGYFVLPTASNVAVALTKARINENAHSINFLQQDLDSVYSFKDPRSYPLSSYSYLIVPRAGTRQPPNFTAAKGRSLSTFIDYFLCGGQQSLAQLGYSPIPLNLVKGGLRQADAIPGHIKGPNFKTMAGCNNPTFSHGVLTILKNAPYPSKCDKLGAPLNCTAGGGGATPTASASASASGGPAQPTASASAIPAGPLNPGSGSGTGTGSGANVTGQVVNLSANGASRGALSALTAGAIILAIVIPPVLGTWLRRRRKRAPG